MKKLVSILLLTCLPFCLVGCAKLPDPAPAVQAFFDEFFKSDGEAFQMLKKSASFQDSLALYPEAGEAIDRVANAIVARMTFEIDDTKTVIASRDGQANVFGTITTLTDGAMDNLPTLPVPYTPADWFDYLAETIGSGQLGTQTIDFTLKLNYDKENGTWVIDALPEFKTSLFAV